MSRNLDWSTPELKKIHSQRQAQYLKSEKGQARHKKTMQRYYQLKKYMKKNNCTKEQARIDLNMPKLKSGRKRNSDLDSIN